MLPSALPAASVMLALLGTSSSTEPSLAPELPAVLAATVQAVPLLPPMGVTELIVGAVPPTCAVARLKSLALTPMTFSLKVTVQSSEGWLVGLVCPRVIEETTGAVVSTAQG